MNTLPPCAFVRVHLHYVPSATHSRHDHPLNLPKSSGPRTEASTFPTREATRTVLFKSRKKIHQVSSFTPCPSAVSYSPIGHNGVKMIGTFHSFPLSLFHSITE
jgi:hypothetical protein